MIVYTIAYCEEEYDRCVVTRRIVSTRCRILAIVSKEKLEEAIKKEVNDEEIANKLIEELKNDGYTDICIENYCVYQINIYL